MSKQAVIQLSIHLLNNKTLGLLWRYDILKSSWILITIGSTQFWWRVYYTICSTFHVCYWKLSHFDVFRHDNPMKLPCCVTNSMLYTVRKLSKDCKLHKADSSALHSKIVNYTRQMALPTWQFHFIYGKLHTLMLDVQHWRFCIWRIMACTVQHNSRCAWMVH